MPSSNLRVLEQRFQALEQRERKLQQQNARSSAAVTGRRIHHSVLADPHLEQAGAAQLRKDEGLPLYANRYAVEETELLSGAKDEANLASKAVHGRVAQNVLSMKQKATAFFDRERGMRQAHLVERQHIEADELSPGMVWSDEAQERSVARLLPKSGSGGERSDRKTADDVHFVPLFGRTPTPPAGVHHQRPATAQQQATSPVSDSMRRLTLQHSLQTRTSPASRSLPPLDEMEREELGEDALISRMVYTDEQARLSEGVPNAYDGSPSATAEAAAAGIRHASLRRLRPQTAQQDSAYANARPLRVRRVGSATVSRQQAIATAKAEERSILNGQRLARAFFDRLPPAIPPTGVASTATRYASKEDAAAAADETLRRSPQRQNGGTALLSDEAVSASRANRDVPPPSGSMATTVNAPLPPFALSPDYYRLQVKIIHAAASLAHWEFTVVITDVTNPKRSLPRHQFRGLRVNPQRHLIFQAPDGVTLDPLRQIPWAMSPQCLYNHTLRLEVFATHPLETKVVDTMVNYGSPSS